MALRFERRGDWSSLRNSERVVLVGLRVWAMGSMWSCQYWVELSCVAGLEVGGLCGYSSTLARCE